MATADSGQSAVQAWMVRKDTNISPYTLAEFDDVGSNVPKKGKLEGVQEANWKPDPRTEWALGKASTTSHARPTILGRAISRPGLLELRKNTNTR